MTRRIAVFILSLTVYVSTAALALDLSHPADATLVGYSSDYRANMGRSIASAGDFNGDGIEDVIVGAIRSQKAHIIYGRSTSGQTVLNGTSEFDVVIEVTTRENWFAYDVAGAGDFNGDGYDDVLVASPQSDIPYDGAGAAFLIFGGPHLSGTVLNPAFDPAIIWREGGIVGSSVAGLGDWNGDGFDDIALGATGANGQFGGVYIIYGYSTSGSSTYLPTPLVADVVYEGIVFRELFGGLIRNGGDINGDGQDDLLVVAEAHASSSLSRAGRVDVFFGQSYPTGSTIHASDAPISIEGNNSLKQFGKSVAGVGDFNGDGFGDIAIGEALTSLVYLFTGSSPAGQQRFTANADAAVIFSGHGSERMGVAVSSAGDFNFDGRDDLLIGANNTTNTLSSQGAVYLIDGFAPATQVTMDVNTAASVRVYGSSSFYQFGDAIAKVDFNNDGAPDFVVGAPNDNSLTYQGGSAAVFQNANEPPSILANAGDDQTVEEGSVVRLDGSLSSHSRNAAIDYSWQQVDGPTVSLSGASSVLASFDAPVTGENLTLTFSLTASADDGTSDVDLVNVQVLNSNSPPEPDAGVNQSGKPGVVVQLDGTGSYDPDNDVVQYSWLQVGGTSVQLSADNIANPDFTVPNAVGDQLVFKLIVSDGQESSEASLGMDTSLADTVGVEILSNSAPVAEAGDDQVVISGDSVLLNGSGSSDPDSDGLSFEWTQTGGVAVTLDDADTAFPIFDSPLTSSDLELVFELVVTDDDPVMMLSSDADTVSVFVTGSGSELSCEAARAEPSLLWPPTSNFSQVDIVGVQMGSDPYSIEILSVTQDESPRRKKKKGRVDPDAIIAGTYTQQAVLLRADRNGKGNGRVYVVSFQLKQNGQSCTGEVIVTVPHHKGGEAIDDGQVWDSLTGG